jgi:protein-S-isoprenylcysteine O-methyltransferase Ste14
MPNLLRQLTSFSLPITALIVVPLWIEPHMRRAAGLALATGPILMLLGLLILARTIGMFIRIGRGTLAPWSPTSRLVISGPYAHVRNPMILGVIIVLLGEALAAGSWRILAWAAAFFAVNTVYFVILEEPGLEKRFGAEYILYKQNVPRWIPRVRPWRRTPAS